MPLDPVLNQTGNFAMAQAVGSRLILYFIPLLFIAISFSVYKFFINLNSKIFILIFILFASLSFSPNIERMQNGLGISEYSILIEKIKPYSTNQTALFVSGYNSALQIYYQRKNLQNFSFFATYYNKGYAIYLIPIKNLQEGISYNFINNSIDNIFSNLKSIGANRAVFLFANYDDPQIQFLQFLLDHLPKSNHEWLIIPSKDAAAVIVEI
jgi:hypothetical protein